MTDEPEPQYDVVEPATPEDAPDTCEVEDCDASIDNFPEEFPSPDGRLVMCDHHHVAARILAYTFEDHPYVDVGLYPEVSYYSRSLAAEQFGIPAREAVNQPPEQDNE